MDYEQYYSYSNARIIALILIGFFMFNYYMHPMDMIFKPTNINQSINTTPTPIIIYKNVTVLVTPTPDGKTYFASEYQSGIRKLGRWFSWTRDNVSGYEGQNIHVKVYDYRIFNSIHIFNAPDYNYYEILPNQENTKYLFIFVKIYMDDYKEDKTKLWLPSETHYYVSAKGITYQPITWDKQLRIKELEEVVNDNEDYRIGYYGVFNTYSPDKKYRASAGETYTDIYWIYPGESNAIDGYIIYAIPKDIEDKDIEVLTDMYSFGQPSWKLIA